MSDHQTETDHTEGGVVTVPRGFTVDDLPMGGCVPAAAHFAHLAAGNPLCQGSIRSTGTVLGFVEPTCCECGQPHADVSRWQLDPESQAKVTAHRARMGWTYSPVGNGS